MMKNTPLIPQPNMEHTDTELEKLVEEFYMIFCHIHPKNGIRFSSPTQGQEAIAWLRTALTLAKKQGRIEGLREALEVLPKKIVMHTWIGKAEKRFEADGFNLALSQSHDAISNKLQNI